MKPVCFLKAGRRTVKLLQSSSESGIAAVVGGHPEKETCSYLSKGSTDEGMHHLTTTMKTPSDDHDPLLAFQACLRRSVSTPIVPHLDKPSLPLA